MSRAFDIVAAAALLLLAIVSPCPYRTWCTRQERA